MDKIRNYVCKCSKGDWFVLYQLSKNLNRPFFMEFLITLSRTVDPETPTKEEMGEDEGDGIVDMMLQPALTTYESKEEKKSEDEED